MTLAGICAACERPQRESQPGNCLRRLRSHAKGARAATAHVGSVPNLNQNLHLPHGTEYLAVEQLLSEIAAQRFDPAVLTGAAGRMGAATGLPAKATHIA